MIIGPPIDRDLSWPIANIHYVYPPLAPKMHLATEKPAAMSWRLIIPRIGVNASIERVGRDAQGAMASPDSLDTVGWFDLGVTPGHPGDAVLDGHFGLPNEPAVFRDLRLLRPGDVIHLAWPDGSTRDFRVATMASVALDAQPPGLFAISGPARLSLITCAGAWDQSRRTYTERLIVTADMI